MRSDPWLYASSRLPVEPGGHQAAAVVVTQVGPVVLERLVPDRVVDLRTDLNVVLLLGQVSLDFEDLLPPLGGIRGPSLADQHVRYHRIVDVAVVLDLARVVLAVEEVVRLEKGRLGAEGHRVVFAVEGGRDVGSVLL